MIIAEEEEKGFKYIKTFKIEKIEIMAVCYLFT